jgi:hypothetical protein
LLKALAESRTLYLLIRLSVSLGIWLTVSTLSQAQSLTGHLPVSRFGAGMPLGSGISRTEGLAGTAVAMPHSDHANFLNPALLSVNEKVQLNMDLRYSYRELSGPGSGKFRNGTSGPANISFAIPISGKIKAGFGVKPFTSRDFVFFEKQFAGGDSIGVRSRGLGGTTKFFVSCAYKISPAVRIGLETSYILGTLEDSVSFGSLPADVNFNFISVRQRRVSQFLFRPGVHVVIPLSRAAGRFLNFGATADLGSRIAYRDFSFFTVKGIGGQRDTLQNNSPGSLQRPLTYSFGMSLVTQEKWALGFDADYVAAPAQTDENTLIKNKNAFSIRLGGEYLIGTKKSTRYLNVITFRGGIAYNQLPFEENGKQLTDRKISLGASFPIIRKEAKFTRPLINLGLSFGQRGFENSAIGLENYYQINLGFTLNDFLWFNRYRID